MASTDAFVTDLDPAATIGLNDLLLLTQVNAQVETGYESLKVLVSTLANFIVNGIQYTQDLDTSSKTIIDAINQVLSNLADTYNATSTYELNDCVVYQGTLYKCTTAITVAEAWNSAHWTQIKAVDVGAGGGGSSWTDITGTLIAGQTSLTISDNVITTNSTIEIFTSDGTEWNSITVSTGSITITFDVQSNDLPVKVRVS